MPFGHPSLHFTMLPQGGRWLAVGVLRMRVRVDPMESNIARQANGVGLPAGLRGHRGRDVGLYFACLRRFEDALGPLHLVGHPVGDQQILVVLHRVFVL